MHVLQVWKLKFKVTCPTSQEKKGSGPDIRKLPGPMTSPRWCEAQARHPPPNPPQPLPQVNSDNVTECQARPRR